MKITRRFVMGLPFALMAAPAVGSVPSKPTIREPFVNVGGHVHHLGLDLHESDLPRERSHKVLSIGEWDGHAYPVTVQGWVRRNSFDP